MVSFDFDDTLSKIHIREYAKYLIEKGVNVFVITTRYDFLHSHLYDEDIKGIVNNLEDLNLDLWNIVDDLNIPRNRVFFTNMQNKSKFIKDTKLIWHLDNNIYELYEMKKDRCKTIGISTHSSSWRNKCERILKKYYGS